MSIPPPGPSAIDVRAARPVRPARPHGVRAERARRPPLERPRECVVSGTSAGLAAHLGVAVRDVRAILVLLTLIGGASVLLYVWCWALMPWQAGHQRPTRLAPMAWILVAAASVALVTGVTAIGDGDGARLSPRLALATPLGVALAVSAAAWATFVDRRDPERGVRHAFVVRGAAAVIALVLIGAALAEVDRAGLVAVALAAAPLLGLALIGGALVAERWRDLTGERVRRVREEQRSAMAAHLHDSVLQTLAVIQNRAGASSTAARLARAQERELRAWLFDADAPADSDLPTDLRDHAAALELDYPVRVDVVSAGLSAEVASGDLAAAAREAMLNAARHAGGEVSVYIEGRADGVEVFVRDRGAGFDVDAIPDDRLGVRESIIGRMRRAGGRATVRRAGEDGGTEVHLSVGELERGGPRD